VKGRSPVWTAGLALLGILVIAVGIIALGTRETEPFPSAQSYLPSGSSALMELFRRSGYKVVVDQNTEPNLQPGDVAVAFFPITPLTSKSFFNMDEAERDPTREKLDAFVADGGKLMSFPLSANFHEASTRALNARATVESKSGQKATVSGSEFGRPTPYLDGSPTDEYQLWGTRQGQVASLRRVGKGQDLVFSDGLLATNRFIDREQNALVVMDAARTIARPGSRVVFVEAAFGNASVPALTELIGPWAKAAWLQLLLLGVVLVYTLGKPFGLPDAERRKQRGTRELLDAMADTLRRGRMTKLALHSVYDDANRLLRKWFRTPRDTSRMDPEAQSLVDLHHALNRVEAAIQIGAPEDEAARMVRDVERHLREVATQGAHSYRPGS
jgi:hypothetical protein